MKTPIIGRGSRDRPDTLCPAVDKTNPHTVALLGLGFAQENIRFSVIVIGRRPACWRHEWLAERFERLDDEHCSPSTLGTRKDELDASGVGLGLGLRHDRAG